MLCWGHCRAARGAQRRKGLEGSRWAFFDAVVARTGSWLAWGTKRLSFPVQLEVQSRGAKYDSSTAKGKIFIGSYGKSRPKRPRYKALTLVRTADKVRPPLCGACSTHCVDADARTIPEAFTGSQEDGRTTLIPLSPAAGVTWATCVRVKGS